MIDPTKKYPGIHNDQYGGMTPTGSIIKDAWLFGILPETETCEGWTASGIQDLYEKVYASTICTAALQFYNVQIVCTGNDG